MILYIRKEEKLMELKEMYELNRKATRVFYEKIKNIEGVELLEFNEGIRFKFNGHTYIFTCEFED